MSFGASASFLPNLFNSKNLKLECTNAIFYSSVILFSAAQFYTVVV